MNSLILSGRLTADIETRQAGEHAVYTFTLAANQGERVLFMNCEAWNMPHLPRCLRKGSRALVRGILKQEKWETADGQRRSRLVATVNEVEFLDPHPATNGDDSTTGNGESAHANPRSAGPPRSQPRAAPTGASNSAPRANTNERPRRPPPPAVREEVAAYAGHH